MDKMSARCNRAHQPVCKMTAREALSRHKHCSSSSCTVQPQALPVPACQLLEADAVDQGVIDQPGQVDATCEERRDAFAADDATCATYTGTDWNHAPWIPVDEDSG